MGYPFGKKGWKVYDLESHEIFISRDVIFYEDIFPLSFSNARILQANEWVHQPLAICPDNFSEDGEALALQSPKNEVTTTDLSSGPVTGPIQMPI